MTDQIDIDRQRRKDQIEILRHQLKRLVRLNIRYGHQLDLQKRLRLWIMAFNKRTEVYILAATPIPRFRPGSPALAAAEVFTNAEQAWAARKELMRRRPAFLFPREPVGIPKQLQRIDRVEPPVWDYMIVDKDANVLEKGTATIVDPPTITSITPEFLPNPYSFKLTFDTKAWAKLARRINEKIVGHKCNHHRKTKRKR